MLKAAKAYLSTQVTTATQGDLLLMLYDTAIKHIKLAKDKMAERDFAAKGILITKAIEIISELHESLNKEKGGEVARNLSKMYFMCNTRLLQANMEMNPKRLDEVVGILSGLRQAFAQIIPGQEGRAPASQSAVLRAEGESKPAAQPVAAPSYPTAYPSAYPLSVTQPVTQPVAQPSVAQPSVAQPSVAQPSVAQPPVTPLPVATQPEPDLVADAPAPVAAAPVADESRADEPMADRAPMNTARFRAANAYATSR